MVRVLHRWPLFAPFLPAPARGGICGLGSCRLQQNPRLLAPELDLNWGRSINKRPSSPLPVPSNPSLPA